MNRLFLLIICLMIFEVSVMAQHQNTSNNYSETKWTVENPIFKKGAKGSFDEVSVKDPTIVYFENAWHMFYTARGNNEYTTGYVSAKELVDLNTAQRFELKQISGKTRYGCAPQIFYFDAQNKWYLIYQNKDSNYQPAFSCNTDISNPELWSASKNLIQKDSKKKWIDFWIIADQTKVYLFYTEAHNGVVVRSTSLTDFPNGWSKGVKVFDDVHEAVHIYKVTDRSEFHMIYELNNEGVRSFGLAKANDLEGPWEKISDEYASGGQLEFVGDSKKWTEMVSHGEVIRSGFNQNMEYSPEECKWIIQGILKNELTDDYPSLPWKLGIITRKLDEN